MRKILFRGKRMDNGEWILGSLLKVKTNSYALQTAYMIFKPDFVLTSEGAKSLGHAHVDPETVGQCTGLKDMNGKWIFEGDVVRFTERQLGGEDVPVVEAVEFSEGGFATHRYFLNNWLRNAINGNCQLEDIEVIGNIHDNPELLEGGEQNE